NSEARRSLCGCAACAARVAAPFAQTRAESALAQCVHVCRFTAACSGPEKERVHMRSKPFSRRSHGRCVGWVGSALAGLMLYTASPASAQDCQSDEDCGAGRVCHTEQYESCTGDCKPD